MIFAPDCFAGKHVLITGASSGLGEATALLLSRLGARLSVIARNEERLTAVHASLSGEDHRWFVADVGGEASADEAVKQVVAEAGTLDGVFHSAGTSIVVPIRLTKTAQIESMFGASVMGSIGIGRALSRKGAMSDGGSIVLMSSVAATRGRKGMTVYSAAKAATSGLVRALAVELADRRIRVNAIAAGAVETAMHRGFADNINAATLDGYRALHPLGFGQPDDVANAAAFLLSDASPWITGTDFAVDGGYAAK